MAAALAASLPAAALAQPAITPASEVRVVEVVDPWSGVRARQVVDDLRPAEIARVQRALAGAGFVVGRATGILDAGTRLALGRFQASRGLHRCDCVTYETILALGIRPSVVAVVRAPVRQAHGSDVVVVLPHRRVGVGHESAVVVGHGPSVFVGHDPARGAGIDRHRPPRGGGHHTRDPRPPRPRPGIAASGSGAEIRALAPRRVQPRTPFPGSSVTSPRDRF